jgi:hypothetical protein
MAKQQGEANPKKDKRPRLPIHFYLNDQLHRKLHINRGKDLLITWNYPQGKRMHYTYTDVLKRFERVFSTNEVATMVNRKRLVIDIALRDGMIEPPYKSYSMDENRTPVAYQWREKDIMGLLDYLSTVHRGRPRKDGMVIPAFLPTPRELRAMIHNTGEILYIEQGGQFVPTWRAKEM